jgi:cell division protein FtsW (lipid II flippase)
VLLEGLQKVGHGFFDLMLYYGRFVFKKPCANRFCHRLIVGGQKEASNQANLLVQIGKITSMKKSQDVIWYIVYRLMFFKGISAQCSLMNSQRTERLLFIISVALIALPVFLSIASGSLESLRNMFTPYTWIRIRFFSLVPLFFFTAVLLVYYFWYHHRRR